MPGAKIHNLIGIILDQVKIGKIGCEKGSGSGKIGKKGGRRMQRENLEIGARGRVILKWG